MKTLCVYHSRTGLSKKIAEEIAAKTDAELLEITDGKDRSGIFGYMAAAVVGLKKTLPALAPYKTACPMAEYDRVIIVCPIWCENVSPIARAFMAENKFSGDVHTVVTHMSPLPYENKIDALHTLLGKAPNSYLSLQTHKFDYTMALNAFLETL